MSRPDFYPYSKAQWEPVGFSTFLGNSRLVMEIQKYENQITGETKEVLVGYERRGGYYDN